MINSPRFSPFPSIFFIRAWGEPRNEATNFTKCYRRGPHVLIYNNIHSNMKASLLHVKLSSLNRAEVWNPTSGGVVATPARVVRLRITRIE